MTSRGTKKNPSANRVSSATPKEAASIATSANQDKRPKLTIWPEWNDADVNAEKWDVPQKGGKEKGKSPVVQHLFDDPEGKIEMPSSLRVDHWARPQDFITEKTPVVVDPDGMGEFDLKSANEHLHESELMRYVISHIMAVWQSCAVKNPPGETPDPNVPYEEFNYTWKPWEHIYANCKAGKGPHMPLYNPHGKYIVRLYWMGCWRKITVDDTLPFDDEDRLLLPACSMQHELWPMLLTKAIIKIASLDYSGGNSNSEFGDCSVIHCLTGWLPELIPLQNYLNEEKYHSADSIISAVDVLDKYFQLSSKSGCGAVPAYLITNKTSKHLSSTKCVQRQSHMQAIWDLLKTSLHEWKLPVQDPEKQLEQQDANRKDLSSLGETPKDEKLEKDTPTADKKGEKPEVKGGKDGGKEKGAKDAKEKEKSGKDGKDDKKDKKDKGDKDKDKHKEKTSEENIIPEKPEVVVFGLYGTTHKYPMKISSLGEMANASEKLRQTGLSHLYPHPVWITQTRSCPLEPPPPPEKVPAWKLIRPKKKKVTPSDEPKAEPTPPKPIQCLEITSPFLNYKVSPVPIPTDVSRPKSSLERGGTHSRPTTGNVDSIEETDENIPTPPVTPQPEQSSKEEVLKTEPQEPPKQGTPGKKSDRKKSAGKREEASPKLDRKKSSLSNSSAKGERTKSAGRPESRQSKGKDEEKIKEKETKPPQPQPQPSIPQQPLPPPPVGQDAGGLAPPPVDHGSQLGEGEEVMEEEKIELVEEIEEPKEKQTWIDFDQFCKCFRAIYIFHKPNTYAKNHKESDMKSVVPPTAPSVSGKQDKKSAQPAAGVNTSSSKTSQTPTYAHVYSPTNPHPASFDDKAPFYLFVDSLKPTDIIVSYSSLSRWHDLPPIPTKEKESHISVKGKDKEVEKEATTMTSSSILDGSVAKEPVVPPAVTPGSLIAEPYSWKSLVTGQPILRIRTTATRAAVLSLPEGRHVLRFMMSAPMGYHVHLCSTEQFTFGDEETVMAQLTKESCRFVDNATQVIMSIGKCINTFGDQDALAQSWKELVACHCPYLNDKLMSKQHHFEIFNEALYNTLRKTLHEVASPEMAFAWRALFNDTTTKNILGLSSGSRPGEPEKVENAWANREATADEHVATMKIQKIWKGHHVRRIISARIAGTEDNAKAIEQLQKAWAILEPTAEQSGLFLFRYMFRLDPDIMSKYPFHKDEWNKISYADYNGTYPDQIPNSWFIVFREIFHVSEETLAVPKLYVPINTCMLRVVNNDTGEEMPRVFQKVAPYIYKKNKKGYTFVAEARTVEQPLFTNKWRMRLIGSVSQLPAPVRNEVNSTFNVREIRDYYIPNNKNIILRYAVKVSEDHLSSLQIGTSKSDVYIKLRVLDNEDEVISTVGKGHAVLPAFIFHKDPTTEETRPNSRQSNKGGTGKGNQDKQGTGAKGKSAAPQVETKTSESRASHHEEEGPEAEEEKDLKPHKYIIEAVVLKNSWPLSESSWSFVQMLKEMEKNELKVSYKERAPSPPKNEKLQSTTQANKTKGGKGAKDKGSKASSDSKGSRPPSQQFDTTKPHWTLRIVSDASAAEEVDVRRDTQRADEIRALKKAWEDAEPGRAAKAMQARLQYLSTHMVKTEPDKEDEDLSKIDDEKTEEAHDVLPPQTPLSMVDPLETDTNLTLEPPTPPTPKEVLQPLDITPFLRKTRDNPKYLDEEEKQCQLEARQREIQEYKAFRESVEQWREKDKYNRNQAKIKQLELCEQLQAKLDAAREAVNIPREAFRQKYLEAERKRQEELAAQEAALKAEQEAKSPKRGKSAKGKKSPSPKKKK